LLFRSLDDDDPGEDDEGNTIFPGRGNPWQQSIITIDPMRKAVISFIITIYDAVKFKWLENSCVLCIIFAIQVR